MFFVLSAYRTSHGYDSVTEGRSIFKPTISSRTRGSEIGVDMETLNRLISMHVLEISSFPYNTTFQTPFIILKLLPQPCV